MPVWQAGELKPRQTGLPRQSLSVVTVLSNPFNEPATARVQLHLGNGSGSVVSLAEDDKP